MLVPLGFYAQDSVVLENDSLILWQKDRKLEWEDFKGKQLNFHGNVLAETHGKISIINCEFTDYVPVYKIGTYFEKLSSWTITKDSTSLEHEQIHFDIYELFARKIRKAFYRLNEEQNIDLKKYEATFNSFIEENNKYNELYDVDVITNQAKQQKWRECIAKELEELKEYEYVPKE